MRKLVLFNLFLSAVLLSVSCKKEIQSTKDTPSSELFSKSSPLESFVKILSKAVSNETSLRSFIAKEALKEIDKDHDVFYNLVKNEIVDNNKSLRDVLTKYEEFPGQLLAIENEVPTLTIFVPTLPENSFSPQTWKPLIEIPYVSSNYIKQNNYEIYSNGELSFKIPADETPGFPVLVVKKNERIELKNNGVKLKSAGKNEYDWDDFTFIDEEFDGLSKTKGSTSWNGPVEIDQIVRDAYDLFKDDADKWHRDYIYYGLKNPGDTGKIKKNFRETIQTFKLSKDAISIISDQSEDPYFRGEGSTANLPINSVDKIQQGAWTEGKYEFQFDILINNLNGLGTSITRAKSISPSELFYVAYERQTRNNNELIITYKPSRNFAPIVYYPNIPLVNWDLQSNGISWKIVVTEKDASEVSSRKESVTSEFAKNFGFDTKIGLKFGASDKQVKTNEFSITTTRTSDDLGSLEVHFWEPVLKAPIRSRDPFPSIHTVENGLIEMAIIPTKYY